MSEQERINKQRRYFMEKAHRQLDKVFLHSLDGEKVEHQLEIDDLATSMIIVWRFDRKLSVQREYESSREAADRKTTD